MKGPVRQLALTLDGHPLYYRAGTPDLEALYDALVREEYDCVAADVKDPKLIVDCGAYAGYTTLFFLNAFRNAHVIAVEPDDENFALCERNTRSYGNRANVMHAAIWSETTGLVLQRGTFADKREWTSTVRLPAAKESPDVRGIDLGTLLGRSGFSQIDVLKMNIHCSEVNVFSTDCDSWLPHVGNMVVQLHDREAEDVFFDAMANYGFFLARPATLHCCTGIGKKRLADGSPIEPQNALQNGDFSDVRVSPPQIVPGAWLPGSTDIANSWRIVVCDSPFNVVLAIRTGLQDSGENALLVRTLQSENIAPQSSPYAAIENTTDLLAAAGQQWRIKVHLRTNTTIESTQDLIRGAYAFLRVQYNDDTYHDAGIPPAAAGTNKYRDLEGVVHVPETPPGLAIARTTLWLYAWIENRGTTEIETSRDLWEVLFDGVACEKI